MQVDVISMGHQYDGTDRGLDPGRFYNRLSSILIISIKNQSLPSGLLESDQSRCFVAGNWRHRI